MGARFAPSVANLFMAHWEEDIIFKDPPPQLSCYRRYIDDLIMVWEGDMPSLQTFMDGLNANNKNIELTWTISYHQIIFLDLEIFKGEGVFHTRNHFKTTDRNAYIPLTSCYHKSWLCNIPRGQFIRLRRNCTSDDDFLVQSQVLADRFKEKGYSEALVNAEIAKVLAIDRNTVVEDKVKSIEDNTNVSSYRIILDYNIQYKKLEHIIAKHWPILKGDRTLGPVLPDHPRFIYRKAPSLRDRVAPGVIDPPKTVTSRLFGFLSGFYACGKCATCRKASRNIKRRKEFVSYVTKKSYKIEGLITCSSEGVVYMLECDCGLQYVGRTSRALHVRIGEHISNIKRGVKTHSVSRHFRLCHQRDPRCLKFWGVEKVPRQWRGGHYIRQLSRRESFWIYETKVLSPFGMNVDFDLNCFISNR